MDYEDYLAEIEADMLADWLADQDDLQGEADLEG